MRYTLSALASGLIFGIGLIVAGMANPAKVLGFLDLAGKWDPSLAFVMGGGIAIAIISFTLIKARTQSLLGGALHMPSSTHIDKRLVGGSLLFGVGWGIAGICPGPALVLVGTGSAKGIVFTLAMLAGMMIFRVIDGLNKASASTTASAASKA